MTTAEVPTRRGRRKEVKRLYREGTPVWRERLIPKTVIGISMLILAAAIGASFSGVCFYAYYQHRLDTNEKNNVDFEARFGTDFKTALATIDAESNNAKADIQNELEPLKKIRAEGTTIEALAKQLAPSVMFVESQDAAGNPSVGSAFVVASDATQSLMLTSFEPVKAATRQPGPQVVVRKADDKSRVKATLWTWDETKDLALLIVPLPNLPKLQFAPASPPTKVGDRIFPVSGLGGLGASVTQGFVADVSAAGIQHDAAVGPGYQGGPIVNSDGKVVGVASRVYAPLGYQTDSVWFAVPGRAACEKVLKCPNGDPTGAGDKR